MPNARRFTRATALAAVCTMSYLLAGAGAASAAPPLDVPGPVTDLADVLTAEQEQDVATALEGLADATQYQLFVVYVDSFDTWSNQEWANTTAERSGLGRDDILLAVAVNDRRYQVSVWDTIALSDTELSNVEQNYIEPALHRDDWAGAATSAAFGYQNMAVASAPRTDRTTSTPHTLTPPTASTTHIDPGKVAGVLGVVILLVGAVAGLVLLIVRRRAATAATVAWQRASSALVEADSALTTAAQDVAFAEAQYGTEAVAPAAAALQRAQQELTNAFATRAHVDDTRKAPTATYRDATTSILNACAHVTAALTEQRALFDHLRDLHANAPRDLQLAHDNAALTLTAATTATQALTVLQGLYDPAALVDVADAPALAAELAGAALMDADEGLAVVASDRIVAVAAAGRAHERLAQAAAALGELATRESDLRAAPGRLTDLREAIGDALVDAARLGAGDRTVAGAAAGARGALTRSATPQAGRDPLAAARDLSAALGALDVVLDPLREAEAARLRAIAQIPSATATVYAEIANAQSSIDVDPSAVGSGARTRLADAQQRKIMAESLVGSDPVSALDYLQTAAHLARQAAQEADSDIAAERTREREAREQAARMAALSSMQHSSHHSGGFSSGGGHSSSSHSSGGHRGGGGRF